MATEWFDVVDETHRVIGKATRAECHNGSKRLHPVVHIHILNSGNKLLLQKRRADKDIQPGKWDTSIGGHIQSGEALEHAITRESLEEAGIAIAPAQLTPVAKYVYESDVEKELVSSYVYRYDGPIRFQESEIDAVQFLGENEIETLIAQGETTPNFAHEFSLLQAARILSRTNRDEH